MCRYQLLLELVLGQELGREAGKRFAFAAMQVAVAELVRAAIEVGQGRLVALQVVTGHQREGLLGVLDAGRQDPIDEPA